MPEFTAENLMTKTEMIASLSASLNATSVWRAKLSEQPGNARAARLLTKLANESSTLSDAQWQALEPFFGSPLWNASLRQVARTVGFRKTSFRFLVRQLIGLLSAPATV
jgi:hypothetical protein